MSCHRYTTQLFVNIYMRNHLYILCYTHNVNLTFYRMHIKFCSVYIQTQFDLLNNTQTHKSTHALHTFHFNESVDMWSMISIYS